MHQYKCVIVGDANVGKSTYIDACLTGSFGRNYVPTLERRVNPLIYNNTKFNVWDVPGNNKCNDLLNNTDYGIIAFDLSSHHTFTNIIYWYKQLYDYTENIVLLGLKSDLRNKVNDVEIQSFTNITNIKCIKISSKNIRNLFEPFDNFISNK